MVSVRVNNFEAIQPTGADFRDLPIEKAFTWEEGLADTGSDGMYLVVFRSRRNADATSEHVERLVELDEIAYQDAQEPDGFGMYWQDAELSEAGVGRSFCIWDSQEQARQAAKNPRHHAAVTFIMENAVYTEYSIATYQIHTTEAGVTFAEAA